MAKKYRDEDWLRQKYWDERKTTGDIADICGVNRSTIVRWLDRLDIETRDKSDYDQEQITKKARNARRVERAQYRVSKRGYANWRSYHPAKGQTSVKVHRLLAVAEYGLDAVKDKVVHHKNSIRWDNRPENIEVMPEADHLRHHVSERGFKDNGQFKSE